MTYKYGLELFESKKDEDKFGLLNLVRNSIVHSGRKFNSKISRDGNKFIKEKSKEKGHFEVSEFEFDDKMLYNALEESINKIITQIEKKYVA